MEHRTKNPRDLRLAAVVVLTIAQTIVFSQVFLGTDATVRLLAGAALAIAICGLLRRRNLALTAIVGTLGFIVTLPALAFPATTWFLLPTGRTLNALGSALEVVGDQARTQIAPTRPTEALLMAGLAAVWAAAFAAHALAIRARAPFLALSPGLGLMVFTALVLGGDVSLRTATMLLIACIIVLSADADERARRSGQAVQNRRRPGQLTATTGGRRMGAAVVGAGLAIAAITPPAGTGFGTGGPGPISDVDPFVSIAAELRRDDPAELFDVAASQGAYWRTTTLDEFDGYSWARSTDSEDPTPVATGALLSHPKIDPSVRTIQLDQTVSLKGWRGGVIPLAAEPSMVLASDTPMTYRPDAGMLTADDTQDEGDQIVAVSQIALPEPSFLDAVGDTSRMARTDPAWYQRYTQLPTVFSPRVRALAEQITEAEPNTYRKMLALQAFLRSPAFTYDEAATTPEGVDPLLYFLQSSRRGFCQQFAGTFTAMARSLGFPARVAIGFQPGGYETGSAGPTFTVTSRQAHAWPEVYFPGAGWLAFEPTQTRSNPTAQGYLSAPTLDPPGREGPGDRATNAVRDSTVLPIHPRHSSDLATSGEPGAGGVDGPWTPWILLGLLAGLVMAVAGRPAARLASRMRLARARPSHPVLAAWDRFEQYADELGRGRSAGETVREFGVRMATDAPHVVPLADATIGIAYGPGERPDQPSSQPNAGEDARQATKELRSAVGFRQRVGGWYRPTSASSRGLYRPLSRRP